MQLLKIRPTGVKIIPRQILDHHIYKCKNSQSAVSVSCINQLRITQKASSAVSVPSQDPVNLALLIFGVAGPISLDVAIYEVLQ